MPSTPADASTFFRNIVQLQSFPVFVGYVSCIVLIPLWKRVLPQFQLKKVMVLYNIICVLLSIACTALLYYGVAIGESIYDLKTNEYCIKGLALYTFSKNFELLDTMFMILRQRWRQVSFLHVFHHSTILIIGNYSYVYMAYPAIATALGLNSLIHVVLYAYYAKAALSTTGNPPAWKRYLTQFQIVQFLFDLVFGAVGYMYHGLCIYSVSYGVSMLFLFSHFYYHAYIKKTKTV